jgi:hypothetical protein
MTERIEALERLARHRAVGAISEAEFEAKKAAILAEQPAGTFMERWRQGRGQRRRVNRVIFWIWLVVAVGILLAGIYILTRGAALDKGRRSNQQTAQAEATQSANAGADRADSADFIITDRRLAEPPTWQNFREQPTTRTFCENAQPRVANGSSRILNLGGQVVASDVSWDIGIVKPGATLTFNVDEAGEYAIMDLDAGKPIFFYEVQKCDAQGHGQ